MHVAKSGRKYRSIPEDVDVETWDVMTPVERMKHLGLIVGTSGWNKDAKKRQDGKK